MPFRGKCRLEVIRYRLWRYVPDVEDLLSYQTEDGNRFVFAREIETDGASVPRWTGLWSFPGLDPMDWPEAAILHDSLWEARKHGAIEVGFCGSNRLLREAIRSLGWPRRTAWLVWLAVTLFGWWYWLHGEHGTEE